MGLSESSTAALTLVVDVIDIKIHFFDIFRLIVQIKISFTEKAIAVFVSVACSEHGKRWDLRVIAIVHGFQIEDRFCGIFLLQAVDVVLREGEQKHPSFGDCKVSVLKPFALCAKACAAQKCFCARTHGVKCRFCETDRRQRFSATLAVRDEEIAARGLQRIRFC